MAEKGFKQLKIDPEFKTLIRPLRREEYRQLEVNLAMEGCREAILLGFPAPHPTIPRRRGTPQRPRALRPGCPP